MTDHVVIIIPIGGIVSRRVEGKIRTKPSGDTPNSFHPMMSTHNYKKSTKVNQFSKEHYIHHCIVVTRKYLENFPMKSPE